MKTLYLHLGYFKTGSSFLQEMWRLNEEVLRKQKITYTIPEKISSGEFGKITSGNGGLSLRGHSELAGAIGSVAQDNSCLLSSEHFFTQILESEDLSFIQKAASEHGFTKIKFLLLLRSPFELMSSLYDQALKRSGGSMTIEEFYRDPEVFVTPKKTQAVIEKLDAVSGADLKLINYSQNKKHILELSSEWLGIESSTFERPDVLTVNRSLSAGERELLRQLNHVKARSAINLANNLCEQLPLISSDQTIPPKEVQEEFLTENREAFNEIQRRLPEGESLSLDLLPSHVSESFNFTREQLEVVVDYLVEYQKKKGFFASKVTSFRRRFGI